MDKTAEMQIFVHAVDDGGFSAAARRLVLTPSAVSKQITRLEDRLGVRLFNRTTRRLHLTAEGRVFYQRAKAILADIEEAEQAMSATTLNPRGLLKINAPVAFGRRQLVPLMALFMDCFPKVQVDLELNDRTVNLLEEEIDVLIRVAELADSSYIARRLASARRFICASPDYLARYGVPQTPTDLVNHNCLHLNHPSHFNDWVFNIAGVEQSVAVSGRFSCNVSDVLYAAVLSGLGLARLSTIAVGEDIKAGRLLPVLTEFVDDHTSVYALYPHRRHLSPKVRAFVDFMVQAYTPAPPWETEHCRKQADVSLPAVG